MPNATDIANAPEAPSPWEGYPPDDSAGVLC